MAKSNNKPKTDKPQQPAPAAEPVTEPVAPVANAPEATAPTAPAENAAPAPKTGDIITAQDMSIEGRLYAAGTILGRVDKGIPKPTKEARADGVSHGHLVARLRLKTLTIVKGA